MDCPVCGKKELAPFTTKCPNCEADVVAFPLLEELEVEIVDILKQNVALEGKMATMKQEQREYKRKYIRRMSLMYWFLFLLPILFFWCNKKPVPLKDEKTIQENKALQYQNDSLARDNERLQAIINDLQVQQPEPIPQRVVHVIQKDESLSSIARKYLGATSKWKVLRDLNPQIENYDLLQPGDTIEINLK